MSDRPWLPLLSLAAVVLATSDANAQLRSLFGKTESVPEISVEQLRDLKLDKLTEDSPYVLVDVRTKEESSVSLIPGAITKFDYEKHRDRYANRTVIVYCTSGYRSEKYARELLDQEIKTKNFKGSILEWCRAGLPLVTPDREPTNRVHTYSSKNRVPEKYQAVW